MPRVSVREGPTIIGDIADSLRKSGSV